MRFALVNSMTQSTPWRDKAQRLIYLSCRDSYTKAQTSKSTGKKYKQHVAYAVPEFAEQLIECLDKDDEARAKTLFLSYDGMKLI